MSNHQKLFASYIGILKLFEMIMIRLKVDTVTEKMTTGIVVKKFLQNEFKILLKY